MKKPRVLITGAAGFLGSHLQEKWEKDGYEVIGLDNLRWSTRQLHNLVIGDILDKRLVDFLVQQVDEVYHLAAQISVPWSNEHPDDTVDINVKGTLNLLEACRRYNKKLIFASSSEVYGTAQTDKISETHPLDAQSVYASTKVAGDRLCKSYTDVFGLDVRIVRSFNTFGKFQRWDSYGGVIALFTHAALHNKPPKIFGDGKQERDYLWYTDTLRGYERIASDGKSGQPYNIATSQTVTINQIAELVRKYAGGPPAIHIEPRPGEVRRLCGDSKLLQTLGWKPETDFEKNIKEYIDWCKGGK